MEAYEAVQKRHPVGREGAWARDPGGAERKGGGHPDKACLTPGHLCSCSGQAVAPPQTALSLEGLPQASQAGPKLAPQALSI